MLDATIFGVINNFAGNYSILDNFFIFITHFGILLILALVLATKDKKTMIQAVLAVFLALVLDQIINYLTFRPRPFTVSAVNLLISKVADSSFPSTHTLLSFAPATIVLFKNSKLGMYALFIALLVGFSRIYVGVHYPSDVLAGMIIGLVCAFLVKKGAEQLALFN
ncbi:phosphatase PAP2 family protein [Candidatus Woesearchaeota archaeon]|nr:phosphatase PAP2 family protein [Candidatus Woesearchaeota archaeon]